MRAILPWAGRPARCRMMSMFCSFSQRLFTALVFAGLSSGVAYSQGSDSGTFSKSGDSGISSGSRNPNWLESFGTDLNSGSTPTLNSVLNHQQGSNSGAYINRKEFLKRRDESENWLFHSALASEKENRTGMVSIEREGTKWSSPDGDGSGDAERAPALGEEEEFQSAFARFVMNGLRSSRKDPSKDSDSLNSEDSRVSILEPSLGSSSDDGNPFGGSQTALTRSLRFNQRGSSSEILGRWKAMSKVNPQTSSDPDSLLRAESALSRGFSGAAKLSFRDRSSIGFGSGSQSEFEKTHGLNTRFDEFRNSRFGSPLAANGPGANMSVEVDPANDPSQQPVNPILPGPKASSSFPTPGPGQSSGFSRAGAGLLGTTGPIGGRPSAPSGPEAPNSRRKRTSTVLKMPERGF